MPPRLRTAWSATAFATATALTILAADAWLNHPLAGFREEYAGGGSCKLRGLEGFELLLLVGLLAFPAAASALIAFAASIARSPRPHDARWIGLAASLGCVALLMHLRFVRPALGICP